MIEIVTKRLVGISEMVVENYDIVPKIIDKPVSLLDLRSRTGKENGFIFYDKDNQDILICHVGITDQRAKFEVSYGTEEKFRGKGYMSEALNGFVNFIFSETNRTEIWAIPNGIVSQHILEKCEFEYVCEEEGLKYFLRKRRE